MSKFERVLQEVADGGREQVSVPVNSKLLINVGYDQSAFLHPRFQGSGQPDFGDELGKGKDMMMARQAGRYSNVGERAIDQVTHPDQTAVEQGTRGAGKPDIARSEGGKRKARGIEQVSQFMAKVPSRSFSASAFVCAETKSR
jgi:hypothetical protein